MQFEWKPKGRVVINEPKAVYAVMREGKLPKDREIFTALLLDAKNRVTRAVTVSVGTLTASLAHPREIFKAAVRHSAASIILVHNHPSGDPTPSAEDLEITERIAEAGRVRGIDVLDHVILGGNGKFESLRERGAL
ncbi:MAG: DNA repair protein RadC [Candidatus Eisenbacteria bacterium]